MALKLSDNRSVEVDVVARDGGTNAYVWYVSNYFPPPSSFLLHDLPGDEKGGVSPKTTPPSIHDTRTDAASRKLRI